MNKIISIEGSLLNRSWSTHPDLREDGIERSYLSAEEYIIEKTLDLDEGESYMVAYEWPDDIASHEPALGKPSLGRKVGFAVAA